MEIKNLEQLKEKLTENKLTVVDFFATWCGPCKMLTPIIEELEREINDVNFIKVNVDEFNELASQFGVLSVPTLVFVKDGKEINRSVGFKSKNDLLNIINEIK
ncbi:MAG: thioredoxin [Ureaplasma sp.]|nr:thioredoxin [Ureaplasma sp.]